MNNQFSVRSILAGRRGLLVGLAVATLVLVAVRLSEPPRELPPPEPSITYGDPQTETERVNVAGEFAFVNNLSPGAVVHEFTHHIPVESSVEFEFSDESLTKGTLTTTKTTEITATISDVSRCSESEIAKIADKLDGSFTMAGEHALDGFPCLRVMEERSYGVDY